MKKHKIIINAEKVLIEAYNKGSIDGEYFKSKMELIIGVYELERLESFRLLSL
ncbi:hypothetical protein OCA16_25945 [Bacillus cereus]|nr:hypothetical protein [Bacillus cereus]